jgi:hypothetical protein
MGFTDCAGGDEENLSLRKERVKTVMAAMPKAVRDKVLFSYTMGTTDFVDTNATAQGRARNRAVRVTFISAPKDAKDPCDTVKKAANLDEYLFLVRCMEKRLALGTAAHTPTAVSVLRQIYYGSAQWSASEHWAWDDVISSQPWSPGTDPTTALQPTLMSALQASQVVEGTDIGHVLTGIDAMLTPQKDTIIGGFGTNVPNEEWATWAGDVGSAAAEWALDAYFTGRPNPDRGAFFTKQAGDADLLGDIDSFAMRAGGGSSSVAPSAQLLQKIQLTGPLSEALLQYFRITRGAPGLARGQRIESFVQAYGGTIAGRKITNRAALIARLRPSVEQFATKFSFPRIVKSPLQPPPNSPAYTTILFPAVDDMTARFVDWLEARL